MRPTVQKPSRLQTRLSLALLALMGIIAAGVLYTQHSFNPAVSSRQQLAEGDAARRPAPSGPTMVDLPERLEGLTPPESFGPQSLSDKIDGKAELYLAAGFERLVSQRFSIRGQDRPWLELFAYDMGGFENAYSVFSLQRREDAAPIDLAEHAYQTENALFLVHGDHYLEIIASEPTAEMRASMKSLADAFVRDHPVAREAIAGPELFPAEGLAAESVARIPSDAFGFEKLDRVFTAGYRLHDAEMTAFFSRRGSAAEAAELAGAYLGFLVTFGGEEQKTDLPIEGAAAVNILDSYEIVFAAGPYFAGVREADRLDQAAALALRLYRRLKTVTDGSDSG